MTKIIYKNYTEEEALDLVKKRYENMEGKFPVTLELLEHNKDFHQVFNTMSKKGYPDWAIYMAIVNTIINYKINNSFPKPNSPSEQYDLWKKHMNNVEKVSDLTVPVEEFTENKLEMAIDLYVMSFLKGRGYEFRRATPNVRKLRKYAEEKYDIFKYDIPHKKWFKFQDEK